MIRILCHAAPSDAMTELPLEQLPNALAVKRNLIWVDLSGEDNATYQPLLIDTFGFHPLAVDDALQESHVPKVDDWDEYLYLVLHAITFDRSDGGRLDAIELDIFLGKNYIVTHHDLPIPAVNHIWESCQKDERYLSRGTDHVLYRIVDDMVAAYMPVVEEVDEAIETLEDQIFDRPTPENLSELFKLKRALLQLRRIIAPQREVLNKLARDDYTVIDAKGRIFFRDIYDHLVRLHDINESMRDLVGGAMDTYLSVINNRMNDIMKTLTVITTLFMPLSFLTGFFGMNFFTPVAHPLESWTTLAAFGLTLAVMIGTPIGMIFWLKKRGWM